jgi:hypothetical protein
MESTALPKLFMVLTEYEPDAPVPRDQPEVRVKTVAPAGTAVLTVQVRVDGTAAVGGQAVGAAATACAKAQLLPFREPVDVVAGMVAPFELLR